jgi:uncharacterized membrane protein YfcA
MSLLQLLVDFLLGVVLGLLGGLFGIGGGLIAIPALGVLFAVEQQMAQGTALVMVVANVALALWRYHQRQPIAWRQGLALGLSGLLSAWLASLLALQLDGRSMRLAFVGFLVLLALFTLWQLRRRGAPVLAHWSRSTFSLGVLGSVSGVLGGLFAVGSAVLATPALTLAAQGLALTLALPATSVTLLTYAGYGQVDWAMGIPLALGGLLSISWGVRLAHALPDVLLRKLFCLFLLVCAAALALSL